jgi:hypothetical protein
LLSCVFCAQAFHGREKVLLIGLDLKYGSRVSGLSEFELTQVSGHQLNGLGMYVTKKRAGVDDVIGLASLHFQEREKRKQDALDMAAADQVGR